MKKKDIEKIKDTSIKDLEREAQASKKDIAKSILEYRANPPKDSNTLHKKRERLAILLTVMNEKKIQGAV